MERDEEAALGCTFEVGVWIELDCGAVSRGLKEHVEGVADP